MNWGDEPDFSGCINFWGLLVFFAGVGVLSIITCTPAARADTGITHTVTLTPDNQYAYAKKLYDEGEFSESVVEFKRFAHFFPDDIRIEPAMYYAGMSFFQLGQYSAAIRSFEALIDKFEDTRLGVEAHHRISEAHLKNQHPEKALISLFNLTVLVNNIDDKDRAYYEAGWIYVDLAQWNQARSTFEKISAKGRSRFDVKALLEEMDTRSVLVQKIPRLAGLMGVIPGAGYLYCNRYRDALTAFIVTGLFAWAAYEAFDDENPAMGSLVSVVGIGFYSGSIFGSISGAHKYNRNQTQRFIDTLKEKKKILFSAGMPPGGFAIAAHFLF